MDMRESREGGGEQMKIVTMILTRVEKVAAANGTTIGARYCNRWQQKTQRYQFGMWIEGNRIF